MMAAKPAATPAAPTAIADIAAMSGDRATIRPVTAAATVPIDPDKPNIRVERPDDEVSSA
jgi:hypothetical protein